MKILVTGVSGQLGHDVVRELLKRGEDVVGSDIHPQYNGIVKDSSVAFAPYIPMDITKEAEVSSVLDQIRPDAVVHCAAWTAVDSAEDPEVYDKVYAVNVSGPENIAKASEKIGAKMLQISTDYVFSGEGEEPWEPDDGNFSPLGVYGKTKLLGEEAVRRYCSKTFVVRIAWVFGVNGHNFVKTILNVGKTHDTVTVVADQIGTPTYTADLAVLLADMIKTEKYGTYHATNEGGFISWYDFTKAIYGLAGVKTNLIPVSSEEYGSAKAKRPKNSRLSKEKLSENGFMRLPCWRDALQRYLKEIGEL